MLTSCGNAEQEQYDDLTGKNVVLKGTWESQPVSFTDGFGDQFLNEKIILSFTDDVLTIKKGSFISQAHGYSRNSTVLTIEDPKYADSGMDLSSPYALEFNGPQFSVSFATLEFLSGAPYLTFTKVSDNPSLTPSQDPPQVKHNLVFNASIAPQCERDGNISYYSCLDCGKLFSDEKGKQELTPESITLPATGHEYSNEPVIIIESTDCTVEGLRQYSCMNCGKYISENYYAPHQLSYFRKTVPDCENAGYDEHYECSICNELFLDENAEQPTTYAELRNGYATGHDYSKREPYNAGVNSYGTYKHSVVCANCDKFYRLENHVSDEDGSHCALCGKTATFTYDLKIAMVDNSIDYAKVMGIKEGSTVENVMLPSEYLFKFEESLGFINEGAFANNKTIKTVYIPNASPYGKSDISVGSNVFDGCDNLTDVYIESEPWIGSYWETDWLGDAESHVTLHIGVSLSEYKKAVGLT